MRYIVSFSHRIDFNQNFDRHCSTLEEVQVAYDAIKGFNMKYWQIDVTCEVIKRYTLIDVTSPSETLVEALRKMIRRIKYT